MEDELISCPPTNEESADGISIQPLLEFEGECDSRRLIIAVGTNYTIRLMPDFLTEFPKFRVDRHYWYATSLTCTETTHSGMLDRGSRPCPICEALASGDVDGVSAIQLKVASGGYAAVWVESSSNGTGAGRMRLFYMPQKLWADIVCLIKEVCAANGLTDASEVLDFSRGWNWIIGKDHAGRWDVALGERTPAGSPAEIEALERFVKRSRVWVGQRETPRAESVDRVLNVARVAGANYPVSRRAEAVLKKMPEVTLVGQHWGTKAPRRRGYLKMAQGWMRDPGYVHDLNKGNIAVLVGSPSGNICTFDLDSDACRDRFAEANPWTTGCMFSSARRGGNFWVLLKGDYPQECRAIKDSNGDHVGECRGGNCLTTISGLHPEGMNYKVANLGQLPEIEFGDIVLPEGWRYVVAEKNLGGERCDLLESVECILDLGQLENVRSDGEGGHVSRCPACAADGKDTDGDNLRIFENGRYACAAHQGDAEHRSEIFKLARHQDDPTEREESTPKPPSTLGQPGERAVERSVAASAPSPTAAAAKPFVVLPGGPTSISNCAQELYRAIAPTDSMFTRGGVVCSLGEDQSGLPILRPVRASEARSLFERYVQFGTWSVDRRNKRVFRPDILTEELARALVDSHVARELLSSINGLVRCPILIEVDGQLKVCEKGYNKERGLLIEHGTVDEVPLDEAVQSLKLLVKDFAFQSPGDRSRALASFITPALKMGGLLGPITPVDVAEANESQSGKGYRQSLIAAVYGEDLALVAAKRGGVGSIDESIAEKLIQGRPFIQLDNLRGRFDSPALEALMTCRASYPCRVPRCREILVDVSRFFVMLSSNGVDITVDLANRASIVRIHKRTGVEFPDTLGEVKRRQSYYLGCVFAVITEWHRRGKLRTNDTRHSFREWCQSLDWIVQNILHEVPLMDGHQAAQERVSNPTLVFLRQLALEVAKQGRLGEALTASQLADICSNADLDIPGLPKGADEDRAKRVIGGKLGPLFREPGPLQIDHLTVEREETRKERIDSHGGSFAVKTYVFSRQALPQDPQ